jgi:hypothetical protein
VRPYDDTFSRFDLRRIGYHPDTFFRKVGGNIGIVNNRSERAAFFIFFSRPVCHIYRAVNSEAEAGGIGKYYFSQ